MKIWYRLKSSIDKNPIKNYQKINLPISVDLSLNSRVYSIRLWNNLTLLKYQ